MIRLFTPLVLIVIAVMTFFSYTNPHYETIKVLRAQEREYDDALTKSRELREQRDMLVQKVNQIAPDDIRKLERILPNNVDNIRLIIDIENIAERYDQSIRSVTVSAPTKEVAAGGNENALAVGATDRIGSVGLSFSTTARYEDFLRFLQDLEKSVRIVDVQNIVFTAGESSQLIPFTVQVKTYWLR